MSSNRRTFHAFIQLKGGTGTTTALLQLAQALQSKADRRHFIIDINPQPSPLCSYQGLPRWSIAPAGDSDEEVENFLDVLLRLEWTDCLLDLSAARSRALALSMESSLVTDYLSAADCGLKLHYVLPGDGAYIQAYEQLTALRAVLPRHPFVIWLNPMRGEPPAYSPRNEPVVRMPKLSEPFEHVLHQLLQHSLTYDDALTRPPVALPEGLDGPLVRTRVQQLRDWMLNAVEESELLS